MFKKRGIPKVYSGLFKDRKLLIATTTLIGTIVGAGMLGIPYTIAKVGILPGFILILGFGFAFMFLNLFAGEVILRTREQHQLTGYAQKYLGTTGKWVMTVTMVISIYGALIAYLIGEGETIRNLVGFGSPLLYTLLFFVVTFFVIFRGVKATGRTELILITVLILVVVAIGVFSLDKIQLINYTGGSLSNLLLPYGVVLFSFMTLPAIPELQEELGTQKHKLKPAIIIGSAIPIVLYLLFTIIVIGVVGLGNFELLAPDQRIATIALSLYSSSILGIFANVLAILAMFTSYLTLSLALTEVYEYDFGLAKWKSLALVFTIPLAVVFFGLTSFISVLAITGAFAGGLEGTLTILMYWRAKRLGDRTPEYSMPKYYVFGVVMIILFVVGAVYQIVGRFL